MSSATLLRLKTLHAEMGTLLEELSSGTEPAPPAPPSPQPPTPTPAPPTPPVPPVPPTRPTPPTLPAPDLPANAVVYERPAAFTPSVGNEVLEEAITAPGPLSLSRMIIELDFQVGPWNADKADGPHALIWLYRGRKGSYRSSTIANLNVHGPKKNKVRGNQNIDLQGTNDTIGEGPCRLETGQQCHLYYEYSAADGRVRCKVTRGSEVVCMFDFAASAKNKLLSIPAVGLNWTLGHRTGLHYEVPSYGWTYSNLRVTMVPA